MGAVLTGIPLWRLSQRLTKQLQLDHVSEKGAILWVYVYQGDKLHHFGTPPDLDTMVPDAAGAQGGPGQESRAATPESSCSSAAGTRTACCRCACWGRTWA